MFESDPSTSSREIQSHDIGADNQPACCDDAHEEQNLYADRDHDDNNDTSDQDNEALPEPAFSITLHIHGKPISLPIYDDDATIEDLSDLVAEDLQIPAANQKFLITPKTGLLKPPFAHPNLLLSSILEKKIVLMGATTAEVAELADVARDRHLRNAQRRAAQAAGRKVTATKHRDVKKIQEEASYTFHTIRPLPYLPDPAKSQRFLERLAADAGIKASMRQHRFRVGLLTEMDPAAHTTHESRTLGLNRNRGEVIELRLRTDAGDGYRDYKVIRKTLCHELAHNVWGPHDRNFWNLCRQIEDEVERNDWRRGGHAVGGGAGGAVEEFYNPEDTGASDEEADHGGWEGGEYVLGGGRGGGGGGGVADATLSRREIMARAAEARIGKQREAAAKVDEKTRPEPSGSSERDSASK
jgi:hypothetical protein